MFALVLACSIVALPHTLDPQERKVDTTAPRAAVVELAKITRGRGPVDGAATSCDDLGTLSIKLTAPATDDRTVPTEMGYILEHAGGSLPDGITLPTQAMRTMNDQVWFYWIDGATDEQEPLDFAVAVIAVDRAGNRSAASEPVWVRHPGKSAR
ncbi:MAG TPA: hypothetical protein VF698_05115 [Thermoanaerobaculia bacterium]|jgi:hypothetical protein